MELILLFPTLPICLYRRSAGGHIIYQAELAAAIKQTPLLLGRGWLVSGSGWDSYDGPSLWWRVS